MNIIGFILNLIALTLCFLGVGGVLSPIIDFNIYTKPSFIFGAIFVVIGYLFRQKLLVNQQKEVKVNILIMDIALITVIQTASGIIELFQGDILIESILKVLFLLLALIIFINKRKKHGDMVYSTPFYLLLIISLIYIPIIVYGYLTYMSDIYLSLVSLLFAIALSAVAYEAVRKKNTNRLILITIILSIIFGTVVIANKTLGEEKRLQRIILKEMYK